MIHRPWNRVLLEDSTDGYLHRIERSWGGVGVLGPHGSGAIYLEILLHAKVTSVMVNGGPDERDEK